jgi:hypothetical protein
MKGNQTEIFPLYCGFSTAVTTPLLGEIGFFEKYKVALDYKRQFFEVKRH